MFFGVRKRGAVILVIVFISGLILVACIFSAVILSKYLPHKPNVDLELPLLNESDCSLEKVVSNLQTANELTNIESEVLL